VMAKMSVERGATAVLERVEGDLEVGNGARIRAAQGNLVAVTGEARFKGNATIECDFECERLTVERWGKLSVHGNLSVHGRLDVSNEVVVKGVMKAEDIDVGGRIGAGSVSCKRMRVGGMADIVESLDADLAEVGGKIEAGGKLNVGELRVGGKAEIGGGTIKGIINVGGMFESSSALEFGDLQVFGKCSLGGDSKGKKISASGKIEAKGRLECEQVEIAGLASFLGDCKATRIEVKGKLHVDGSLSVSDRLDVLGEARMTRGFEGDFLNVSGRFAAERAIVNRSAEVYGQAETQKGLKADSVVVRSGSSCEGPIIAKSVEVGSSGPSVSGFLLGQRLRIQAGTSRVGDVYASRVVIGAGSRARWIYAENVELGSGCDVEGVAYTSELKVADHVSIANPVQKVDMLKEPSL
jgi:cytoskeletal protein CcmA (bactofilin family)